MSKERLEEIKAIEEEMGNGFAIEDLDLNTMTVVNREHFNWLIEQSERNVTAQETVEILGESLKQLIEQNKHYRDVIENALGIAKPNALYSAECSDIETILSSVLEESK